MTPIAARLPASETTPATAMMAGNTPAMASEMSMSASEQFAKGMSRWTR
jgi:hypothetical protein